MLLFWSCGRCAFLEREIIFLLYTCIVPRPRSLKLFMKITDITSVKIIVIIIMIKYCCFVLVSLGRVTYGLMKMPDYIRDKIYLQSDCNLFIVFVSTIKESYLRMWLFLYFWGRKRSFFLKEHKLQHLLPPLQRFYICLRTNKLPLDCSKQFLYFSTKLGWSGLSMAIHGQDLSNRDKTINLQKWNEESLFLLPHELSYLKKLKKKK